MKFRPCGSRLGESSVEDVLGVIEGHAREPLWEAFYTGGLVDDAVRLAGMDDWEV